MTASAPWLRVRNPVAIPDPVTPATLATMPDPEFAELLRGNLLPRTEARDERRTWTDLWSTLARDNALADRVFGVLSNWLDLTQAALAQEDLDEPQRKRAIGFIRLVGEAWARTIREGERRRPLAWAGPAGAGFDPADTGHNNPLVRAHPSKPPKTRETTSSRGTRAPSRRQRAHSMPVGSIVTPALRAAASATSSARATHCA